MSEIVREFGNRVAMLRKKAGLTQVALAHRIGMSSEAVSRIENGSASPTLERVAAIARALDVPLAEFFPSGKTANDKRAERILAALRRIPSNEADLLVTIAEAIAQRRSSR